MADSPFEQRVLRQISNTAEFSDDCDFKWPEAYIQTNYSCIGNISYRSTHFKSFEHMKEFVLQCSELNNVNFSVNTSRKNKDGSLYRLYRCHHGSLTKGTKVTNTK